MNIRYAALLCGFVMIAAVPVLADRLSDDSYTKISSYTEIHAGLINAVDAPEAKSSLAVVTLLTSSSDSESHSVNLSDSSSFERTYSTSDSGKAWGKENGDGDKDRDHKKGGAPVAVPEPGSLSLLLIGLAGIGVIAFKRGAKQKAVSTVGGF